MARRNPAVSPSANLMRPGSRYLASCIAGIGEVGLHIVWTLLNSYGEVSERFFSFAQVSVSPGSIVVVPGFLHIELHCFVFFIDSRLVVLQSVVTPSKVMVSFGKIRLDFNGGQAVV